MKVYAITKGCYSDYHICCVTTDKEKAEVLAKKFSSRYDPADVEEYDTEEWEAGVDRDRYIITFDERGNVVHVEEGGSFDYGVPDNRVYRAHGNKNHLHAEVLAKDTTGAVKIAAEKRAKYLAEQAGL
jgi:hypothetical protein